MSVLSYYKEEPDYLQDQIDSGGMAYWVTRDGRSIQVKHMTTDHINNVLTYFNRRLPRYWVDIFKHELRKRKGDS